MPTYSRTNARFGSTRHNKANRYRGSSGGGRRKATKQIDPARFIKIAKPVTIEQYQPANRFADFHISPIIKDNLAAKGFVDPTPIQDQAIPAILEGNDLIGIANTGTGKTAAFAIPMINHLMDNRNSKALVIAPTRELAQQIEQECRIIGQKSRLFGTLLIGGTPMGPQLRDLTRKPEVIIGTPGRIKDHLQRGSLNLSQFNYVVLDEVDRMLDMGFVDDVRDILSNLNEQRQSLFFSATMDERVRSLINTFSNEPVTVSLRTSNTSDNVHQDVVHFSHRNDKIDKLHDLLVEENVEKVIIFDETQRSVERLNDELVDRGFKANAIHGGKTQGQRERALRQFKKSEIDILVATDVAARGIDVKDITHVINYTAPQSYEDYIHRVGRAGRAGKTGYALTFVTK